MTRWLWSTAQTGFGPGSLVKRLYNMNKYGEACLVSIIVERYLCLRFFYLRGACSLRQWRAALVAVSLSSILVQRLSVSLPQSLLPAV